MALNHQSASPEDKDPQNTTCTDEQRSKNLIKIGLCLILVAALLAVGVLLYFKNKDRIVPKNKETTIFIATDIHLYSNNLIGKDNKLYLKENFTNDGRVQEYDYQLVEALIAEVNEKQPEFLVLTGDLAFNGELDSHLELSKLLSKIENTQVLVIPGNHDVYAVGQVSAFDDSTQPTENITAEDFREIYADHGYKNAYSYDKTTLSYIYELDDDKWALMLDTSFSRYNEQAASSITRGGLEESTLLWLEEHLAYAKEHGISVISFSHHNLLAHNDLFVANYTVQNSEQITALFAKYGVSLNFSGHLHIQSIKQAEVDENVVHDVSGVSLLDYGNRYGVLEIYENCYRYTSQRLDEISDCEDIGKYSFDVFCDEYYAKTLWSYQSKLGDEKGEQAVRLLSEINAYYFDGSYEEIHRLVEENKELIDLIKENTYDYENSYVASIIEVENKDQHSLLIGR